MSAKLAAAALTLVGSPWRLHGRNPATGLDCIGLLGAALGGLLVRRVGGGREVRLPSASSLNPLEPAMPETSAHATSLPWWRHGLVWMIIGGPAAVVVAGVATFLIAVRSPDPLVPHDSYRFSAPATPGAEAAGKAMLPAQQGRNHAASPEPAR